MESGFSRLIFMYFKENGLWKRAPTITHKDIMGVSTAAQYAICCNKLQVGIFGNIML